MSAQIVLAPAEVESIRAGATVLVGSSDGKLVNLSTMRLPDDGRFRVTLSLAKLDLIERDAVGLVVGDDRVRGLGWTVRVQA